MDASEIPALRLRNQRLAGADCATPESVVAWFGAMQAQEFALAKWSIGQRSVGLDDGAVQRAFDEGRILRLHALRPTWHFVAAPDLRWIQALTGPRVRGTNQYYERQLGLEDRTVERAGALIAEALRGNSYRTRAELGTVLAAAGLPGSGGALAYLVMRAELAGIVASGPLRGRQHTYALVDERAPNQAELHGDDALAELARRYLTSHGPATVKDFAWWSSLTVAQIRRGIALLGAELASVEVGGLRYWYVPVTTVDGQVPAAHVLQAYDEYTIAYKDSRLVTLPSNATELGTTIHSVIVDGQPVALWRREAGSNQIVARVRPLKPLNRRARREVEAAFARYARFAGVKIQLSGEDSEFSRKSDR